MVQAEAGAPWPGFRRARAVTTRPGSCSLRQSTLDMTSSLPVIVDARPAYTTCPRTADNTVPGASSSYSAPTLSRNSSTALPRRSSRRVSTTVRSGHATYHLDAGTWIDAMKSFTEGS